jgi:ABC-type multidrug transport system ATPase subunit
MLTISGLCKTYGNGVQALDAVSLEIPCGMFGLLGPNGAGKSTLMRTIATLQKPDSGTIALDDINVLEDPDKLRNCLGYLPQEFGAYPRTSPEVMLNHIAVLKGITDAASRKKVVEQLLARTNLWDVRKKSIDNFSGGMKQRFGIAQALIGDPKLIIADEPTAGLDPVERRRFHNLLTKISEDVVVVLSTHIVDDVADLCPLMAIMGDGRILVEGAPEDLVSQLRGRLWHKIVPMEQAAGLRQALPVLSTRLVAGQMEIRVVADAQPEGGLTTTEPTLEDVYFATLLRHGLAVDLD